MHSIRSRMEIKMGVTTNADFDKSGQRASEQEARERRKRIDRLKRIIIWICVIMILIPIIVSIVLMVKINRLEKDIDKLITMKESGEIVVMTDEDGDRYLVNANDAEDLADAKEVANDVSAESAEATTNEQVTEELTTEEPTTVDDYTGKRAYLTFDDGPSVNTIPILDTLDKYGIKATFFVIGKPDDESKKLYKEIVDRGSALGLHSYSHDYSSLYASIDSFSYDLNLINELVKNASGKDVRLFRFPGGSSTTTAKVDIKDCIRYLRSNGYKYVDWNVSSEDATGKSLTGQQIADIVISESLNCNNAYILMHDAKGKESTVASLPMIIEQLQANGFKFYSIDENSENLCQHVKESSVE